MLLLKKYAITLIFFGCHFLSSAQQYDNIWILGYFRGSVGLSLPALDFRYGYPTNTMLYTPFDFQNTNASLSDYDGNLVLFTNGLQIANRYQRIIENSENFNYDTLMASYGETSETGDQCAIILACPDNDSIYYVFHNAFHFLNTAGDVAPVNLLYSVINMNQNNGLGNMTHAGIIAVAGTMTEGTMQAVKHGNGRDWWVTMHEYGSGIFYAVLLSPQGVSLPVVSHTGPVFPPNQNAQSLFTPDGSKYICIMSDDNVRIANFDRCSGQFSYSETFSIPYDSTYGSITGCAISFNSRYLYVNNMGVLFQFDLQADSIPASKKVVGRYDGFGDPFPTQFVHEQLGPDGKIYISTWDGCLHLSVINDPDSADTACNFVQHQLELSGYSSETLPLMPNYRLAALSGSACDTLTTVSTSLALSGIDNHAISIYPNPTTGVIFIEPHNFNPKTITIYDVDGRLLYALPYKNIISLSALSTGIYFIELTGEEGVIRRKVVKC